MRDLSHSFSKRSLFSKTTNSLNHLLKLCQLLCQLISSFSIVPKNVGKLTLYKLALALTSLSIFLFRFFGGLRGSTVPWTCFIVIVQVAVWYVLGHYLLQFSYQVCETWASCWIFPPAFSHQLISKSDKYKCRRLQRRDVAIQSSHKDIDALNLIPRTYNRDSNVIHCRIIIWCQTRQTMVLSVRLSRSRKWTQQLTSQITLWQ